MVCKSRRWCSSCSRGWSRAASSSAEPRISTKSRHFYSLISMTRGTSSYSSSFVLHVLAPSSVGGSSIGGRKIGLGRDIHATASIAFATLTIEQARQWWIIRFKPGFESDQFSKHPEHIIALAEPAAVPTLRHYKLGNLRNGEQQQGGAQVDPNSAVIASLRVRERWKGCLFTSYKHQYLLHDKLTKLLN